MKSQSTEKGLLQDRNNTYFSLMPAALVSLVCTLGFYPESDISKILRFVVRDDHANVKLMLDNNPLLLLEAGNVEDAIGNEIIRVTPYECALGAGNGSLANLIASYFPKLDGGEEERARQAALFEPFFKNPNLKKGIYNFDNLLNAILNASASEVRDALKLNFSSESQLASEFNKFRSHFSPKKIYNGLHIEYGDLLEAMRCFVNNFKNLYLRSGKNQDKLLLFWIQVVGFIQRGVPMGDRTTFPPTAYDFFSYYQDLGSRSERISMLAKYRRHRLFPPNTDKAGENLGFVCAVSKLPEVSTMLGNHGDPLLWQVVGGLLEEYIDDKFNQLVRDHTPTQEQKQQSWCTII